MKVVSSRRYGHEIVAAEALEHGISLLPWPVSREQGACEAVPDDRDSAKIWYQEWPYDQPRKVKSVPREDNVGQAGCFRDGDVSTKGPTAMEDI